MSTICFTEITSFKKKVYHQNVQKKGSFNQRFIISAVVSDFNIIRVNNISKPKINKKAEIGSPW